MLLLRLHRHAGGGEGDLPDRRDPADPRVAERFELYVCGIELANAFVELTDPVEQRVRFVADRARRHAMYGPDWPLDEDFLAALEQFRLQQTQKVLDNPDPRAS